MDYLFSILSNCFTDPGHLEWFTHNNPHLAFGVYGLKGSVENNQLLNISHNLIKFFLSADDESQSISSDKSCFKVRCSIRWHSK